MLDAIDWQYGWYLLTPQKICMKMLLISECLSGILHILTHKLSFSYFLLMQCAVMFQKHLIGVNMNTFYYFICKFVFSYPYFVNFWRGYTLRLIKYKVSMILQVLLFHIKLEQFGQILRFYFLHKKMFDLKNENAESPRE